MMMMMMSNCYCDSGDGTVMVIMMMMIINDDGDDDDKNNDNNDDDDDDRYLSSCLNSHAGTPGRCLTSQNFTDLSQLPVTTRGLGRPIASPFITFRQRTG